MTTPTVNEIKAWSIDEVVNWAKTIIDEKYANKLKEQKVKGSALLRVTDIDFERWGIPGGPASELYYTISEIKSTTPTVDKIKAWSIDEVVNWAKTIIDEEDANKLKEQEVKGSALLIFDKKHFYECGIPVGPAIRLYSTLSEIKGTNNQTYSGNVLGDLICDEPTYPRQELLDLPLLNREKDMEEFLRICLQNRLSSGNHKLILSCALQEMGSGKTYFGKYVISASKKNDKLIKALKKDFGEKEVEWVLSAKTITIDFRYELNPSGSLNTTLLLALIRRLLELLNPEDKIKAQEFWKRQYINTALSDVLTWFVENYLHCPVLVHFDEIDFIYDNAYNNIPKLISNDEVLSKYHYFWILIHPLLLRNLVYCSTRSPMLYNMGHNVFVPEAQRFSPGRIACFIFDGLKENHISTLLGFTLKEKQKKFDENLKKKQLEFNEKEVVSQIYELTLGIPRLVYWAVEFYSKLILSSSDRLKRMNFLYNSFRNFAFENATAEVNKYIYLSEERKKAYLELFKLSLLEIKLNGGGMIPNETWCKDNGLKYPKVPLLHALWNLGVYLQKSPSTPSKDSLNGSNILTEPKQTTQPKSHDETVTENTSFMQGFNPLFYFQNITSFESTSETVPCYAAFPRVIVDQFENSSDEEYKVISIIKSLKEKYGSLTAMNGEAMEDICRRFVVSRLEETVFIQPKQPFGYYFPFLEYSFVGACTISTSNTYCFPKMVENEVHMSTNANQKKAKELKKKKYPLNEGNFSEMHIEQWNYLLDCVEKGAVYVSAPRSHSADIYVFWEDTILAIRMISRTISLDMITFMKECDKTFVKELEGKKITLVIAAVTLPDFIKDIGYQEEFRNTNNQYAITLYEGATFLGGTIKKNTQLIILREKGLQMLYTSYNFPLIQ